MLEKTTGPAKKDAFIVRTTTKTQLGLANNLNLCQAVTRAGEKFLSLEWRDATRTAFELIHMSGVTNCPISMPTDLKKLGLTLQKGSIDPYSITPAQAAIIGHELVYQLKSRQSKFLSLHTTDGCEAEHKELSDAINNEPTLLYIIYTAANRVKKVLKRMLKESSNCFYPKKQLISIRVSLNSKMCLSTGVH